MGLRREGAGIRPRRTGRRPHVVLEKYGGALQRALGGHNLRLKPRVRALELSGRPIHGCVEGGALCARPGGNDKLYGRT